MNNMMENSPATTKQYYRNLTNGKKRINLDIPESLWTKVSGEAELKDVKKRDIVIQALQEYLHID